MGRSVLIVDDSRLARMMVAKLIGERWPDAEIREAENADAAMSAAQAMPPDHVILDHNMPGMAGLDMIDSLREIAPGASVTVVTANIQSAVRRRAEEAGCHFVAKPVTAEKIDKLLADLGSAE